VLHFIAATSAKEGGDARLALKIITRAGEMVEERGLKQVTIKEAREASKMSDNEVVYDLIGTLPEHHKLVLYSIAMLTKGGGSYKKLTDGSDTYLFSGEVYSRYKSIAEGMGKEAKSERWYRKYISELEMQGLIISFESGKGIRGHTKLIKLVYPPDKTKDVLEAELFGKEKQSAA
jgi:cell division control protein 6